MPTPRHISGVVRALQDAAARPASDIAISGQAADPNEWILGTIERSAGDLANSYDVSLADGMAVTASSVLDGVPHEVGDQVWLTRATGRVLIVGLR